VPSNQRNHYLREISLLAKALSAYPAAEKLRSAAELNDVRDFLLDLISTTKETVGPDTRARMIQLQARATIEELPAPDLSKLIVEPVTLVAGPGLKPVVLAQNLAVVDSLDSASGLIEDISARGVCQVGGWRVLKRGSVTYQNDRIVYDCLAVKGTNNAVKPAA
jgi:hypothetical protein